MNLLLWAIPLILFVTFWIIVLVFVAPYLISKGEKKKIQELCTILKFADPEILQKIDKGQREITIYMFDLQATKFENLCENPNFDFNKFLFFEKGKQSHTLNGQNRTPYYVYLADVFIPYIRENCT